MTARRLLPPALAALLVLAGAGCDIRGRQPPSVPGSTLERTVGDPDGNGELSGQPGEPFVDRTDLAPRGRATRQVARFGQLTDTHVRDEESPARVPFLDRLGPPVTSTFRPQEALSPQVLTAAVRSMNAERPQAVLMTGDLVDNAQRNELDQFLAVVQGGRVDPNSGGPGYRGVQASTNPDGLFYRPGLDAPRKPGLLRRAEQPFVSPGLRSRWLPAVGNHDVLLQGELPPSPASNRIATGRRALLTFDPSLERIVRELPRGRRAGEPGSPDLRGVPLGAIDKLLARGVPGRATTVPRDPRRRAVTNDELLRDLRLAAGVPGSGPRLDYAADLSRSVRAIVLDTVNRAGGADGVLTGAQVAFLRRELARARASRRMVVVVDHHGLDRVRGGAPALALLARDPGVIAEIRGDTHRNAITPVRTPAGGYWRITTSSLADFPMQGRMFRVLTGRDGSRMIETWMVDQAGGAGGGDLAGAARELSFIDAQGGRPNGFRGRRADRNVRLWLPPSRP